MSGRVRYVPDEVLAIAITAAVALTALIVIVNVSRAIDWILRLPFME